jgi:lipopolysaccharide transport system ATP-binding protein
LSTLENPVECQPNQQLVAEFTFTMPRLAAGDYTITAAIANGTQEDHVQHHWIHDAVHFKSESTSITGGLIGIPMQIIALQHKSLSD